jgi:molybdopterin-guanine dinucleotide biosynthesis protein B
MPPVVSIVGKSGIGKTELVGRLIKEFKKRGYKIAAIKHSLGGVEVDRPGKDSWRLAEAGSDAVVISSPDKLVLMKTVDHDPSIEEILHVIGSDFDLVLAEGFRKSKAPKIEVYKKELGEGLMCSVNELSAIASDGPIDNDVPQLPLANTQAIADFIEKNFLFGDRGDVSLFVNGKQVSMKPYVKDVIAKVSLAMVSTLKGVKDIRNVDISMRIRP